MKLAMLNQPWVYFSSSELLKVKVAHPLINAAQPLVYTCHCLENYCSQR